MYLDIWYNIGLHLDYESLYDIFQTSIEMTMLKSSSYFWSLKSEKDFSVNYLEYDRLLKKLKTGKEVYLYFAGINGIPIKGSERYGDTQTSIRTAALSDNVEFLSQFIDWKWNLKNLKILGRRNSSLISKLKLDLAGQVHVMLGAIRGNHLSLIKELVKNIDIEYSCYPSYHWSFLKTAIKSENPEIIEYLSTVYKLPYLDPDFDDGHENRSMVLFYTCATGNLEMVKYIMNKRKCTIDDYNKGLSGAAKAGNIQLMNLMISLGAHNGFGAIIEAAKYNRFPIVVSIYNWWCNNLDSALNNMTKKGNIETIQKLIKLGANFYDINSALKLACRGNNLPAVKFLLSKVDKLPLGFLLNLYVVRNL